MDPAIQLLENLLGFPFDSDLFQALVNANHQAAVIEKASDEDLRWALRAAAVIITAVDMHYRWTRYFNIRNDPLSVAWEAFNPDGPPDPANITTVAVGALLAALPIVNNVRENVTRQAEQFVDVARDKQVQMLAAQQHQQLRSQLGVNFPRLTEEQKDDLRVFIAENVELDPPPAALTAWRQLMQVGQGEDQ